MAAPDPKKEAVLNSLYSLPPEGDAAESLREVIEVQESPNALKKAT